MFEQSKAFATLSRAARELLGWTQSDLSAASGISISAIKNYERERTHTVGTTAALRAAFEREGVEFIIETRNGESVIGATVKRKE